MTFTGLLIRILLALGFLIVGWIGSRFGERLTVRALERLKVDPMIRRFAASVTRWGIVALVVVGALGALGITTYSFAAVLGAAGLAIGLALQGVLQNLAAGVLLLVQRPFAVGHFIRAGGETGTVVEVGLFNTLLDTPDNRRLVLPNKSVFGGNIENVSFHARRRVDLVVGVNYGADVDRTREVLLAAAQSVPGALEDPAPQIVLDNLADSSVNWQVRVWAPTPDFLAVRQATIKATKNAIEEAGLSIPFPQLDVHLSRQGD